jgi:Zn-dependent protease with chaperone function
MSYTMDFFHKQDISRRWSLAFGVLFGLVLAAFSAIMYIGFRIISLMTFSSSSAKSTAPVNPEYFSLFAYHQLALVLTLAILFLTLFATLKRLSAISSGGSTFVATTLKAVPLGNDSVIETPEGRSQEKALKNIAAEMAIAASIEEPNIYILPYEEGINAMAVGLEPDDSAIIISKGALRRLSRDELSGLVAHEFSHILNGDTRHFTLMSGWLHGLFFVQILGRKIVTKVARGRGFAIGVFLICLGLIASLCGKVVQAAFSRSRERLADASAAQFTRDPKSLASVLKKIGGLSQGSRINSSAMPELRHLFLAKPDRFSFLASHPPLEERIWELDPGWDGWYHDFEKDPVDFLSPPQAPPSPNSGKQNSAA